MDINYSYTNTFQKMLLMKTVLDTAVQGSEVDPSLLLICNREERKSCITKVNSTNQTDSGSPNAPGTSLFKLMCDCNVEVGSLCM